MRLLFFLLALALLCNACNNSAKTDNTAAKPEDKKSESTGSENIRNDIKLTTSGINIKQAFLLFEDGRLVPADNKVEVGQKVNLRLLIEGWNATDGKVMLGASERITTDEGSIVLDEEDLFAGYPDGVDAKAAEFVTLSAIITRVDKLFKYFEVAFRVWDKKTNENVTGSYRLYLK
jgi:hypothetical protein